jgi:hypothetical protein
VLRVTTEIDLVVNTFERTYRHVLRPGFFAEIEAQNRVALARRTALINNVSDRRDAAARAEALVEAGEIDNYSFVEDLLEHALEVVDLRREDLGRVVHYIDAPLAAVTMDGPPWLLYWDADVRLAESCDWITPSQELMAADARVLVTNPRWVDPTLDQETIERRGAFALGLGFSDQLFLTRRTDLAAPIYRQRCVALLRSPMAHLGHIFESRVDAWMRHHDRLRATYLKALYVHPAEGAGASYPASNLRDRLRWYRNRAIFELARHSPIQRRCWRYM